MANVASVVSLLPPGAAWTAPAALRGRAVVGVVGAVVEGAVDGVVVELVELVELVAEEDPVPDAAKATT